MGTYKEEITVQSKQLREFINLTPQVKSAMEKSGLTEGIILVMAQHSNSGVILSDEEPGLLEDISAWLEKQTPLLDDYHHGQKFESNAGIHLRSLLLNQQVVVSFSQHRLDLGPWQYILYAELDGQRPKRIVIRVMGE